MSDSQDEEVRRRLVTTKDSVESIATACHFTKLCRLKEAFAAECGCTMEECRATRPQSGT